MPNNLTDAEIKKALECCLGDSCYTSECSFFEETKDGEHCQRVAVKHALDLINRQTSRLRKVEHQLDDALKMYNTIKAEAYKEFAKRLIRNYSVNFSRKDCFMWAVDNLLNELVGDLNGKNV